MALLSIPEVIRDYGSLQNIWEGSYVGEGFLSKIKSLIKDLHSNWHINAGLRHHRKKAMKKYWSHT
eukprot:3605570-Ditylum_brightwellii.AAC.1